MLLAGDLDAGEEGFGGFVVGVLGDELAAEGFGEDGLVELRKFGIRFSDGFSLSRAGFQYSFDDVEQKSLLADGWNRDWKFGEITQI